MHIAHAFCSLQFAVKAPAVRLPSRKTGKPARKTKRKTVRAGGHSSFDSRFAVSYLFFQKAGLPKSPIGRVGIVNRKRRKRGLSSHDAHASLNASLLEGKYALHFQDLVVSWGPLCTTFRRKAKKRILFSGSLIFNLPSERPRLVPLLDETGRRARKNNKAERQVL